MADNNELEVELKIGLSDEDKQQMADEIYDIVNNETQKELDEMHETIQSFGQLRPAGTDTSTNILNFNEDKGVYVATDNGYWYYWNGSAYVYGGVYQATEVADKSVTPKKTSFISTNVLYENELLEVTKTGTWAQEQVIVSAKENTIYTLFIEEITGLPETYYKYQIDALDSIGTQINTLHSNKLMSNIKQSVTTPENTTQLRLRFMVTNATDETNTGIYKNVLLVEGEDKELKLSSEISFEEGTIKETETSFITRTSNLFDKNEIVVGKQVNKTNGWISDVATWSSTKRINVSGNSTLTIKPSITTGTHVLYAIFNELNAYVTGGETMIYYDPLIIDLPEGANNIIISFTNNFLNKDNLKLQISLDNSSPNYNKKPYILNNNIKIPFNYKDYGLPILYLEGKLAGISKDNKVNLNYIYGERSGTCTLKWQGTSSLAYPKKNYTINFDNPFEAKEDWGEQSKYCLKANYIDYSHARNVVSAKLWGQVVKSRTNVPTQLNSLVNGGGVDGFPVCVVINGEYQGLYTFNIPKDAWLFGMGNGTNECVLCSEGDWTNATLFKKPAVLDGTDYSIEYITDEDNTEWAVTSFNNIYNALQNATADNFESTVGQYIDLDSTIDYFIFVGLIHGFDNIAKNRIIATYNGVKWFMSAYDMDSTYGLWWTGKEFRKVSEGSQNYKNYIQTDILMSRLVWFCKDKIKERYAYLRANCLSENNVEIEFLNFVSSIPKAVLEEEYKIWNEIPSTSTNNVNQIIEYYKQTCKYCDEQMENL